MSAIYVLSPYGSHAPFAWSPLTAPPAGVRVPPKNANGCGRPFGAFEREAGAIPARTRHCDQSSAPTTPLVSAAKGYFAQGAGKAGAIAAVSQDTGPQRQPVASRGLGAPVKRLHVDLSSSLIAVLHPYPRTPRLTRLRTRGAARDAIGRAAAPAHARGGL